MYTERRWGTRQRHAYRAKLLSATAALGENPLLGIALDHIRAGLRPHSVESHILYYLIRHGEIEIVRILHERADATLHLAP